MHVRIDNIGFEYPRLPVLNNITFDIPRGDFLSIIGPNGSGKSTLLRLMARILLPREGRILLEDKPLNSFTRKELARRVGFVPQEAHWLFPFTVMEVVLMGRSPYIGRLGFESREDIDLCRDIMRRTDIEGLAGKPITAISGGERQRVLIARALAQQPSLLLLDEPNAHLDLSHQAGIFEILADYRREHGVSVVWVSHDLNLAASFSDRVLVLVRAHETGSRVAAIGTPVDVLTGDMIKKVFDASVTVDRHPGTGKPRIFLDTAVFHSRNQ